MIRLARMTVTCTRCGLTEHVTVGLGPLGVLCLLLVLALGVLVGTWLA